MKISMYLGGSKYWWAYLGLKSNPGIVGGLEVTSERVVFFDELAELAEIEGELGKYSREDFFIFWDGVADEGKLDEVRAALPGVKFLAVGGYSREAAAKYGVRNLYTEGPLKFDVKLPEFDERTAKVMRSAGIKTWMMPLKNIAQNRGSLGTSVDLLVGKKRVVFCGSYGTIPVVMASLCERHGVDAGLFAGYPYYCEAKEQSLLRYKGYLKRDGLFLAELYGRGLIDGGFLLSAVHLLGREYFIEKVRASGWPMFANGYATGLNVNVYTTPFYKQHVFLDFGSVAGAGNYPRLADLQYFGKKYVAIDLTGEAERTAELARSGELEAEFERRWESASREIAALMGEARHG